MKIRDLESVQFEKFINRCLDLARLGNGFTGQNPLVGSVIIRDNIIIGEGYHKYFGGPHAEVNAIRNATLQYRSLLSESTLFISLEPCNHHGKTPPCTEYILNSGITSVLVSSWDPNPDVKGGGLDRLASAGLETGIIDVHSPGQQRLLRPFLVNVRRKRPYIILKWAESKDGFMGKPGKRVKISEPVTDRLVHKWRAESDAIMIGTNTAISDNPQLTNRYFSGNNPIRVVVDRKLRIPENSSLYSGESPTWILTWEKHEGKKDLNPNTEIIEFVRNSDELKSIIQILYSRGVGTLLIEGGAKILTSFLETGLWDECRVIVAPFYLGNGIRSPEIGSEYDHNFPLRDDTIFVWLNKAVKA